MRAWPAPFLACVLTLCSVPAWAQQRVTIENFPKDKKGAVRAQVASAVCAQAECVPPSRVTIKKKLDWKRVARERIQAVLSGSVSGKGAKEKLSLVLVDSKKQIIWRKSLKLVKNKVPPRPLGAAVQELIAIVQTVPAATPPTEPPPTARNPPPAETADNRPFFSEQPPDPNAPPTTTSGSEPDAGVPPDATAPSANGEQPVGTVGDNGAVPPPEEAKKRVYPIIVAELGVDLMFRDFAYQGLETGNLYGYTGTGVVMPSLHVEVFPAAPFTNSVLGGLGLYGDVAFAVGLKSMLNDESFPTNSTRWGVGIKWAIRPIAGSRFTIGPDLGYRSWSFSVQPGSDGTVIAQLPELTYSGLDLGGTMEVPLGNFGTLSFKGAYLPVFSAATVLSPDIFPSGHASGFTAELGLGFYLDPGKLLELRLTGIYTQYNMTFTNVGASDTYRATGSTDRWVGGRLGLRVRW